MHPENHFGFAVSTTKFVETQGASTTYFVEMKWFEKIRAKRELLGISQAELAKAVDISQAAINKIEGGGVLRTRFLPRIAKKLGIPLAELDEDYLSEFTPAPIKGEAINYAGPRLLSGHNIFEENGDTEIQATQARSDGHLIVFSDSIGKISRPPFLSKMNKLSAFLLESKDMAPEFEAGDIVFGTPELEPVEGSTCLFISTRFGMPDASFCKLRRITHISADAWAVRTWQANAREDTNELLRRDDWKVGVLIVAKYYGRFGIFPTKAGAPVIR